MLETKLGKVILKNPIMPASGCYGYGEEYNELYDISCLGALAIKGTTIKPKEGNALPRIAETPCGMLNSIGLENPGLDAVVAEKLPWLAQFDVPIVANISADDIPTFVKLAQEIAKPDNVQIIELNVSCPNVKKGGILFSQDLEVLVDLVKTVKANVQKPVFVKLSPNTGDIKEVAQLVEKAGADGISLINTLKGMRINPQTGETILANRVGGLSGPAVKPVALAMVNEVFQAVDIPIIAMGGINSVEDVIEMFWAGASAIAIGTANFSDPFICPEIIDKLPAEISKIGFNSLEEFKAHVKEKYGK